MDMSNSRSRVDRSQFLANGIKVAAFVGALGFVLLMVDHGLVIPTEIPAMGPASLIVPHAAATAPADRAATSVAQLGDAGAAASTWHDYPAPANDAARDEDGHPPSF